MSPPSEASSQKILEEPLRVLAVVTLQINDTLCPAQCVVVQESIDHEAMLELVLGANTGLVLAADVETCIPRVMSQLSLACLLKAQWSSCDRHD